MTAGPIVERRSSRFTRGSLSFSPSVRPPVGLLARIERGSRSQSLSSRRYVPCPSSYLATWPRRLTRLKEGKEKTERNREKEGEERSRLISFLSRFARKRQLCSLELGLVSAAPSKNPPRRPTRLYRHIRARMLTDGRAARSTTTALSGSTPSRSVHSWLAAVRHRRARVSARAVFDTRRRLRMFPLVNV